jgi:beta-galactosidase/beta-glucuronidase
VRKAKQDVQFSGEKSQKLNFKIALAKKEVKLWHFDFPNLYTLKLNLISNKRTYSVVIKYALI